MNAAISFQLYKRSFNNQHQLACSHHSLFSVTAQSRWWLMQYIYGCVHLRYYQIQSVSVQRCGSWDQFSQQTKQHKQNTTSNICPSELLRGIGERRQHVQQQHTWTSGGSQQRNNKQTKVCRSLTGFIVHGWAPLRQTKKTSKKKNMEMQRDLWVSVLCACLHP